MVKESQIIEDVRICIDEIGVNSAEFLSGTDDDDMVDIIRSKIPDAIIHVRLNADPSLLKYGNREFVGTSDSDGILSVTLFDDIVRVASVKLEEWDYPVTDIIGVNDRRYAELKNPITTGYPDNPKAAIRIKKEGTKPCYALDLYRSSDKGREVSGTITEIFKPSHVKIYEEGGSFEGYAIEEILYRSMVYYAAGLTLLTFKDSNADALFALSESMMPKLKSM